MQERNQPENCPGRLNSGAEVCMRCCWQNDNHCLLDGKMPAQAENQEATWKAYKKSHGPSEKKHG